MNNRRIYIESILYFLGSISVAILSFIISLLYSKMFSPSEYGVHSLVSTTYILLSQLCSTWISTAILRYNEKYRVNKKQDKFYGSFFQLHIIISILFIIIPNLIINLFNLNIKFKILFFIFTIIYFFEQLLLIINTMLRANREVKLYNYNSVLNNFIKILSLITLYYFIDITSIYVIALSMLLADLVQCVYLFIKLDIKRYFKIGLLDFIFIKEMFKYAFPLIGVSITSWILNVSDRYIIGYFYSDNEVGLYSYAYLLGNNLFWLLVNFIMLGAYPNIVKSWESGDEVKTKNMISKYLKGYFTILIPACVGVLAIAKELFIVITDKRYHNSYSIFIIICFSIAILGVNQFINKIFELNNTTKIILKLNIIVAITNIVLNIIFIPTYGYYMGAITTLLSYLIYMILAIVKSRSIMKIYIEYRSLLKILIASLFMFIICNNITIWLGIKNNLLILIFKVSIGIISYIIFLIIFREVKYNELIKIINIKTKYKR